jgi:hypothetical protein
MTAKQTTPASTGEGRSDQVAAGSITSVSTDSVRGSILTTFPPRRTITDRPLRALADHARVIRRRQYARSFEYLVDGTSTYPPASSNIDRGTPYGLAGTELRVEWNRQTSCGWFPWELEQRLCPSPLADLKGVPR